MIKKKLLLLQLCIFALFFSSQLEGLQKKSPLPKQATEKAFVIVIPSYNNKKWCELNLKSVINQKYKNFRIVYLNDASTDGTEETVETVALNLRSSRKYSEKAPVFFHSMTFDDSFSEDISETTDRFANQINSSPAFFTLVNNVNRCGALCNLYRSIYSCLDEEIIVTVDGDDWLSDNEVLIRLNKEYSSNKIWLTHGNMIEYPKGGNSWCEPVPSKVIARNAFREFKCPSHLRTFYTWLFKKISLKDLLYNGQFFSMTWDMAIMYPMIEMAGERHAFISTPNYIYNMSNPINDNKVNADLQNFLDRYIRSQEPYTRLEN